MLLLVRDGQRRVFDSKQPDAIHMVGIAGLWIPKVLKYPLEAVDPKVHVTGSSRDGTGGIFCGLEGRETNKGRRRVHERKCSPDQDVWNGNLKARMQQMFSLEAA